MSKVVSPIGYLSHNKAALPRTLTSLSRIQNEGCPKGYTIRPNSTDRL